MKLSKADIHIHSNYSDAKPSVEDILKYVVLKTDLKIIAITDHDTIKGALEARKIAKEKNLKIQIIIGEEVSTKDGHVLGLFLNHKIPPGLSVKDTIKEIKKQGGLAIASHPFYQTGYKKNGLELGGIGFKNVTEYKEDLDGLETVNGNLVMYFGENSKAKRLNEQNFSLSETGGSDAHLLSSIGKSYTYFWGDNVQDLKKSILNKQTFAIQGSWDLPSILEYTINISIQGFSFLIFVLKTNINVLYKKLKNFTGRHSTDDRVDFIEIPTITSKDNNKS
jgi:predicted metal-dependent phosphoesterase TrpH